MKTLKEYLDEKGKLATAKVELVADFKGTIPKAPEKADSMGMKFPKQATPENYKAANNNIEPPKGDKGLSDLGDKDLVYEPNTDTENGEKEVKTWPKNEAKNHLGEREFRTYYAWLAAVKKKNPNVKLDGNKDICTAIGVGEWDGEKGVIYADKKTTNEFVDLTKDMSASDFAKFMVEQCGCGAVSDEDEIPQVTAYAAGKFHPHPPEVIRYIASLSEKNPRILENLIFELKNKGLLKDMMQTLVDSHPESYDSITSLLGDPETGPSRVNSLIKSMDDDYSNFENEQSSMYESVDDPVGFDDSDSPDENEEESFGPDTNIVNAETPKKKLKKKFAEDHLIDGMTRHPRISQKMKR